MVLKDLQGKFKRKFVELVYGETGADLVEYALILALVVVVAIFVLTTLGERIVAIFEEIVGALGG